MTDDLLDAVLALARDERALGPDAARNFGEALRDRTRLILEARLAPVEARAAAFEKEAAWRAETIASLEAALEKERAWREETVAALQQEIDAVRAQVQTSAEAHDRLLAHHRGLVEHVVRGLDGLVELLPWRSGRAKARLVELAAALRKEIT